VQRDATDQKILPVWARPLLHDNLLRFVMLMKSAKGAEFLNTCSLNKYNRFMVWEIFFQSDKGSDFEALRYFWKLQLQLGRSSAAVEQFISRVHAIMGDPRRRLSREEWLEYSTTISMNGPTVPLFEKNYSSPVLKTWTVLGHKLVEIGADLLKLKPKQSTTYGPEKRAHRNKKKELKRKQRRTQSDQARGKSTPGGLRRPVKIRSPDVVEISSSDSSTSSSDSDSSESNGSEGEGDLEADFEVTDANLRMLISCFRSSR
jgi:hypothetical protein